VEVRAAALALQRVRAVARAMVEAGAARVAAQAVADRRVTRVAGRAEVTRRVGQAAAAPGPAVTARVI
jgi:hypothetical protein